MGTLTKSEVLEQLRREATNSSHFVWLTAKLEYYRARNGWTFAYLQRGNVTLFALEPLAPEAPLAYDDARRVAFHDAWTEVCEALRVQTAAFVSVYSPFLPLLAAEGFHALKVGEEPWVNLDDCIPRGNSGKGVRAARNQALRAGITVEEWKGADIASSDEKRATLREILAEWESGRLVEVAGFLNAVDPFAQMDDRRYFVVRSPERVEAFLVATPIPGRHSYFLEDLVIRRGAPNGCGELVTLEAMVTLGETGARQASLGVVSLNSLGGDPGDTLAPALRTALKTISRVLRVFYNTGGLEIYRRRFKPHSRTSIYLAVRPGPGRAEGGAWLATLGALLSAFAPRLRPSLAWAREAALRPVRRYGISLAVAVAGILPMLLVNRLGSIPSSVLSRYGFYANAPLLQWPLRSLVSDFLYFDAEHFILCHGAFVLLCAWAERTHRRKFLIPFLLTSCVFDDILNYFLLVKPFSFFQPETFSHLVIHKDVGSSLLVTTLLGMQIQQFRRWHGPALGVISVGLVMMFLFPQSRLDRFALDLNHMLFYVIGYLVGHAKLEYERHLSRQQAKRKPPEAKSVAPAPVAEGKRAASRKRQAV